MSLSNQDAKQLRTRLERNNNLSPKSKTNLNAFINNKKNAFDRSTFMQQYNAKMRNLRNRDASLGINSKRKRSRGNLNSAMENSNGSVSGGSVNPGKRGRNSPRGPLSAVSGASNTSNEENNASTNENSIENLMAIARQVGQRAAENNLKRNAKRRKSNSQPQPPPPLVTAATAAANNARRKAANAKATANNARRRAVANAKKKAIIARQQVNANSRPTNTAARAKANANARAAANAKAKENYNKLRIKRNSLPRGLYNIFSNTILQNAVKQGRYQNMNTQINSKIKLANNNERRIKIQLNKIPNGNFRRNVQSKINNVRGNNSKTTALLQQINTEQKKINANAKAKAVRNRANANAARARANANAAKNANARVNVKINNLANIRDVVTLMLSKDQLIEIAKNLKVSYTKSSTVPKLKDTILKHNNKNDLIKEVNNQLVGDAESKKIAEKVNSYISGIPNNNRTRPEYTASLVILYIKDLSKAARTNVIKNGRNLLQFMNGINSRTISNNNIKKEEKITNEEFTDLVFIMWLDGVHDKYITKTLDTWFNETTLFSDTQKELVVKGWDTPFIRIINSLKLPKNGAPNILKSSLEHFSSGWEKDVKTYLTEKYKNDAIPISTSLAQQVTTSIPQNINIGVDQEYTDNNENSITRFIQNHTRATNSKTDVNTLITYGQAFDPGRSMVSGGVHEDIEKLTLDKLLNNKFISKKKYYLCDMKIDLKVAAEDGRGETSVFKLQVQKDSSNNVNTLFNNKKILTGISARQAKNANGDIIAVSKYFGDALQYYSLAVMDNRTRTKSPKTERFFFGSGDSMALLGYDRVCEILKKSVRMVIDFPEKYGPKIHVVGMNGTVRNTPQPAYSTMTGAGVKNNIKNNAISKQLKSRSI
jgi:hypothetical protein